MDYLFESEARVSAAWRSTLIAFQAFIFLLDMVSDVAVGVQLISFVPWAGALSLSLVALPILAYGVHEITKTVTSDEKVSWQKVMGRVLDVLFCPIFAFLRYMEKLFWLVEASVAKSKEQREHAERRSDEPRRIEWYIAWRALFQAAPQSLLQMMQLILIGDVKLRSMQAVCGLTSIISVTIFAAKFNRFESQDGNRAPWRHQKLISDKESKSQTRALLRSESLNSRYSSRGRHADVVDSTMQLPKISISPVVGNKDSGIEEDHPETPPPPPPLPPRANTMTAPSRPPSRVMHSNELDSIAPLTEMDYRKMPFLRYSYAERSDRMAERLDAANRRSSYHYLQAIESDGSSNRNSKDVQPIILAPDFPAPAPPLPPDKFSSVARSTVQLPKRKKGRKYLEQDSAVGISILLMHWFLFTLSRVISIGGLLTLAALQLVTALVSLGCLVGHVAAMVAVVTVNSDRSTTKWWRSVLLGVASFSCLVEYGVKFEKSSRIMMVYYPMCMAENFVAAFLVYRPDQTSVSENWWFIYLFYTMVVAYLLALICLVFYHTVLAPKRYVVYYE